MKMFEYEEMIERDNKIIDRLWSHDWPDIDKSVDSSEFYPLSDKELDELLEENYRDIKWKVDRCPLPSIFMDRNSYIKYDYWEMIKYWGDREAYNWECWQRHCGERS